MPDQAAILVVDDNKEHADVVAEVLEGVGHRCRIATSGQAALRLIKSETFDVVVTDLVMHGVTGLDILQTVRKTASDTEVILMTAHGTVETAVSAMELGAFTFITKPVDLADIRMRVERALERARLRREVRDLRAMVDERFGLEGIIGHAPAILRIVDDLRQVAPSTLAILISGEPGTGKELIAKAIHQNSNRRDQRFVPINCSRLEGPLLESELFGHVRGAYTGADRDREGQFEYADAGTLFLDEIGDLPLDTQAKLLRVLQDNQVVRLGSNKPVRVDVRIVSATNKDLRAEIEKGRFREDLYSRIRGLEFHLPPLHERPSDIPLLAQHYLMQFARENKRPVEGFSPDAMSLLLRQRWKGNVRELQQFCQGLVLFARDAHVSREDVAAHLERTLGAGAILNGDGAGRAVTIPTVPAPAAAELSDESIFDLLVPMTSAQVEEGHLRAVLHANGGNRKKSAESLGLSERTIYRRLQEYHID